MNIVDLAGAAAESNTADLLAGLEQAVDRVRLCEEHSAVTRVLVGRAAAVVGGVVVVGEVASDLLSGLDCYCH